MDASNGGCTVASSFDTNASNIAIGSDSESEAVRFMYMCMYVEMCVCSLCVCMYCVCKDKLL